MKRLLILAVLCATALRPAMVSAQSADPDSVKQRNNCRLAEQILTTGTPAPHWEWARGYIPYCGYDVWGRVGAGVVQRLKTSTDTLRLAAEWRNLNFLRDSTLFRTALDIASDEAASPEARVFAMRYLLSLSDPNGGYEYGALAERGEIPGMQPRCTTGQIAGKVHSYEGIPIPPDYHEQIRAAASALLDRDSAPPVVHSAALCVRASPVRNVRVQE
jgi:hypothetical protein